MKILFGADIILSLIKRSESLDSIAVLLKWAKLIGAECYTDISTIAALTNFVDVESFDNLKFLNVFKKLKPKVQVIKTIEMFWGSQRSNSIKYGPLFAQLNWLYYDADYLVTENPNTHNLARLLNIDDRVFSIEEFIERCSNDNRDKDDALGVAISKVKFGSLDYDDSFFNDFRLDYLPYYKEWFAKKANDNVYVAKDHLGKLRGLLKLKIETREEDYSEFDPILKPARRLKICSLKAHYTTQKLGQRFMRIIFETALAHYVDEIYITIVANSPSKERLIGMIEQWGFTYFGARGKEDVYVRDFRKVITRNVSYCFPFHSSQNGVFLLPIYKSYARQLLPPISIVDEETVDVEPAKQAIRKVVILHADHKELKEGSIILFYQKADSDEQRVVFGVGVVEHVYRGFSSENQFVSRCQKRSTLLKESLHECWLKAEKQPIVVDFLYVHYFRKAIAGGKLASTGVDLLQTKSQCPLQLTSEQFKQIIKDTSYAETIVVD